MGSSSSSLASGYDYDCDYARNRNIRSLCDYETIKENAKEVAAVHALHHSKIQHKREMRVIIPD